MYSAPTEPKRNISGIRSTESYPPHTSYYDNTDYSHYPVIHIKWAQARTYCQWRGGDLPTEAQWEKAAQGKLQGNNYPWGNEGISCGQGAFNGANFESCGSSDTLPVGRYSPNGYGLYDMAGNVWEWVLDWYQNDYYRNQSIWKNPSGPSSGQNRVIRGGSWINAGWDARTSNRASFGPTGFSNSLGFRCAHNP